MPVNVKVMIPVTLAGYTGQREAYEEQQNDYVVVLDGGDILLKPVNPFGSSIRIGRADLEAALKMVEE